MPVFIMEVMSFRIPCIATDVGGAGEIITDGKDEVFLRTDFKALGCQNGFADFQIWMSGNISDIG